MRIISFGGYTYPVQEPEDSLTTEVRNNLITLRNGGFDPDGEEAVYQPVTLTKRFTLAATDTESIDEQVDDLKRRFNRRGIVVAEMDDGELRQSWAKTVSFQYETRYGIGKYYRPVIHTMQMDYPFWLRSEDLGWKWGEGVKSWGDTLTWGEKVEDQSITSSPHSFTIDTEPATAPIRRGKITVQATAGGSLTDLRLENSRNGFYFEWTGTLTAGDILVLDLLPQQITKNGASDYANLFVPDSQLEWMRLEPEYYLLSSENPITVRATAISGTVKLYWQYARHFV